MIPQQFLNHPLSDESLVSFILGKLPTSVRLSSAANPAPTTFSSLEDALQKIQPVYELLNSSGTSHCDRASDTRPDHFHHKRLAPNIYGNNNYSNNSHNNQLFEWIQLLYLISFSTGILEIIRKEEIMERIPIRILERQKKNLMENHRIFKIRIDREPWIHIIGNQPN